MTDPTFDSLEKIKDFVERFEEGKLSRAEWTHNAHFIVALCYVTKYPSGVALKRLKSSIFHNNEAIGIPNNETSGYHETLTCFYTQLIIQYTLENEIEEVLLKDYQKMLASPITDKAYPLNFYQRETVLSEKARKEWVQPDIQKSITTLKGTVK